MNLPAGSLVRLLVVDPHPLYLRGFRALVDETPGLDWAGGYREPREALAQIKESLVAIVAIEARCASELGFTHLRELQSGGRPVRCIVLADTVEERVVFQAVTDGVHGFLLKSTPPEELVEAIRLVHQGQQVIDPTATEVLLRKIRADAHETPVKQLASLSPQERRVLARVAEGKTNREIGADLNLSEKTVKNYLSKVLEKLGMHRRAQAAAFYARHLSRN